MKELSINEVQQISGASLRPSDWMFSAAAGALIGAGVFTITAFSANPVTALVALSVGPTLGAGFHAAHDILREYGY